MSARCLQEVSRRWKTPVIVAKGQKTNSSPCSPRPIPRHGLLKYYFPQEDKSPLIPRPPLLCSFRGVTWGLLGVQQHGPLRVHICRGCSLSSLKRTHAARVRCECSAVHADIPLLASSPCVQGVHRTGSEAAQNTCVADRDTRAGAATTNRRRSQGN